MIEQGWARKLKILKFNSSVKPHVFPNPIIINCPCSFMHHIFDNQFSFNGPNLPQPFKFHFITKVERIAKKTWNVVTFIKRSHGSQMYFNHMQSQYLVDSLKIFLNINNHFDHFLRTFAVFNTLWCVNVF